MVVDAKPADLALEMRIVKFMLDYNGAKEAEYEKLRRAESRAGKDARRSWLHRAAETLGLTSGEEYGVPPSLNEIDVCLLLHSYCPTINSPTTVPSLRPSMPYEVGF